VNSKQLFLGASLFLSISAKSQLNFEYTEGKILLKGKVLDLQSKTALSNASIVVENRKKGMSANLEGEFQIYVYPFDTLRFSSLGYIYKEIPVGGIPEEMRYSLKIELMKDFYKLKEVTIYPFRDKKEFEVAFVKGDGVPQVVNVPGMEPAKYYHKEKAKFYNPISTIYEKLKNKRRAANPDFKP
jgi:hypothetical protein